jgi:hypothetical protein
MRSLISDDPTLKTYHHSLDSKISSAQSNEEPPFVKKKKEGGKPSCRFLDKRAYTLPMATALCRKRRRRNFEVLEKYFYQTRHQEKTLA